MSNQLRIAHHEIDSGTGGRRTGPMTLVAVLMPLE